MADLYRKSSLEKISSPDQLDKVLKITNPLSWLVLIGITVIIAVTIVWSICGTIPETITTSGVLVAPISTNSVYIDESGIVIEEYVTAGSELYLGDAIMKIQTNRGENCIITSDQVGSVSEVLYAVGDTVNQNSEVIRISPSVTGNQVVVCYASLADAKKIKRGMSAYIYLSSADSQTYGHMEARIINVDSKATSTNSIDYVAGSDNNLASTFTSNGAVAAITCEIYPSNDTQNGYYWSSKKGGNLDVTNGSLCSVKIITNRIAPISKLFSKIEEIWGG
jgi:hypothetical protein